MKNTAPLELVGLSVEVRNGDINTALRKLKKKMQEDGKLQEIKDKEHYEKPTSVRKKAKAAAKSRWRKTQLKQQQALENSRMSR